jgi:2-polyprenyl-3-methyl-5-hydroxy-6-metoxy-1,4-benzoquinol methylase
MNRLDDPALVARQYSCEKNLRARQSIYAQHEGRDARAAVFEAVQTIGPRRLLEVGGGQGELAERIARELRAEVTMVDQSERMVELAAARGLAAQVGDVQQLPFADGSFDVAVAAWMLYHVPDLDRGLGELTRVLEPGGHLVAVTNGEDHIVELREVVGTPRMTGFSRENGTEALLRHFAAVEQIDLDGVATITDAAAVHGYRDSMMTSDTSRELVFELPLRVRTSVTIFVATR